MAIGDRLRRSWNVFLNKDPTEFVGNTGAGYSRNPDRPRFTGSNGKSIITSLFVRIALDVASTDFKHCIVGKNDAYSEDVASGLNECLTTQANIDQTNRAFIMSAVLTMFDKGVVALIPTVYEDGPDCAPNDFDVCEMRIAEVIQFYPQMVRVRIYNDITGQRVEKLLPKRSVCIIENPFYAITNEPNSVIQRLMKKLSLLDMTDDKTASGKLDIIVQLPYNTGNQQKREGAEIRRNEIEMQLTGSRYGIAYIGGTEKIIQLNRPVDNNLLPQIQYLTDQAFAQLCMTQSILDGTANEQTMLNYFTRTIEPIVAALADEMKRKWLSTEARAKKHAIKTFRNPFKLVPLGQLAEIADKFTRNEILTANEMRQIIGFKPSDDPKADKLNNSNISQSKQLLNNSEPNGQSDSTNSETPQD